MEYTALRVGLIILKTDQLPMYAVFVGQILKRKMTARIEEVLT